MSCDRPGVGGVTGVQNGADGVSQGSVALLFTDIEGGVRLWEADRTAMAAASSRHNQIVREQIEIAGGRVFKTMGDAFRVAFADPSAALTAAVAVQRAVGAERWPEALPIQVRTALHSGLCLERDGDYFGPVVNRLALLLSAGRGGQLLLSGAMCELLADRLPADVGLLDLGEHHLKDLGRAERVFQVTGPGLAGGFGPLWSLDDPALRHNLPSQATTFVGRAAELAEVGSLVGSGSRLVTIVGPGGIGKSRLALQVAVEMLDGSGDGVWLVELAPVADPELVARTVAAVLLVGEQPGRSVLDTVVDAVSDRYLLIVLDNAEHVLGAAAKLADAVIRACPRAGLLITSREPLGVNGERVFRLPPLAVPPGDLTVPEQLTTFEAVQLFAERASMHRHDFTINDANAEAVAAVCARLDGIPLALELAAARLGSLSVSEINSRLDQRLRLLTGGSRTAQPRHQTLRAMIDWSYETLNTDERSVLDRLSVFAGGWNVEAAEAVSSRGGIDPWQVLDHLAALVDKSLVQAEEIRGSTRYRMLETIRDYAAERLAMGSGSEPNETRAAHCDHYLNMVETADAHLRGPDEAAWLDRLEVEFDNIRVALAFSVGQSEKGESGLRLAAGLRWFCNMRGHGGEILEVLNVLLERPDSGTPSLTRARALTARCHLLDRFGDDSAVPSTAAEAISIARSLGDDAVPADALSQLSWFRFKRGDLPAALSHIDEAVVLARRTGDPRLHANISPTSGVRGGRGRPRRCLGGPGGDPAPFTDSRDGFRVATTLANLGIDELTGGELEAARASSAGGEHAR